LKKLILLALLIVFTGCQPPSGGQSEQTLPTLVPSQIPAVYNLDDANRVAAEFLDAWQRSDFAQMHSLISFANREATPLEDFVNIYQRAHDTMSLERLEVQSNGSGPEANFRVVAYNYNATFQTRLFGEITDKNREMQLVFDDTVRTWRVAWSTGDIFREMGSGGQLKPEVSAVKRGSIFDRNGKVLADMENPVVAVNVIKQEITQPDICFATLTQALSDTPAAVIQARLDQAGADWRAEIGTLDASGFLEWQARLETDCNVTFEARDSRKTRRYLDGKLAPHIIGNVGYLEENEIPAMQALGFNRDAILGRSGIELSQDAILRGQPGARLTIVTPGGDILREVVTNSPKTAESVWLTIDSDLQQVTLDILKEAYDKNLKEVSKGGAAIVLDVNTGEILAMVSFPVYDINAFTPFPSMGRGTAQEQIRKWQEDPRNPLLNRATQGRYPSGSVMKIATTMAVLDSDVFTRDQRYVCGGIWQQEGLVKTDWNPSGHGLVTPMSAVTQSCNPFYYEVGYQMNRVDPYLLPRYLRQMGLGVPTGLTDIVEDAGYIGDPDTLRLKNGNWTFADATVMAIGQGEVEVTPLQMIRLTAAVANGGTLYKPQLLLKSGLLDTFSYTIQPEANGELNIRQDVIELVREGMCDVTTETFGTAEFVFRDSPLQEIGVCGKTGTAQNLPQPTTHAWFAGYAPRDKPEIAVLVMLEDAGEGSEMAAPLVKAIMEYYFFKIK
jgi:penicillin-binding protein 2